MPVTINPTVAGNVRDALLATNAATEEKQDELLELLSGMLNNSIPNHLVNGRLPVDLTNQVVLIDESNIISRQDQQTEICSEIAGKLPPLVDNKIPVYISGSSLSFTGGDASAYNQEVQSLKLQGILDKLPSSLLNNRLAVDVGELTIPGIGDASAENQQTEIGYLQDIAKAYLASGGSVVDTNVVIIGGVTGNTVQSIKVDSDGAIYIANSVFGVTGNGGSTGALRVTIADDSAGAISIDNAIFGVTGNGVSDGALRVTLANDSTGIVSVTNAALGVTGNGTATGALRVTLASDSTGVIAVTQSGDWTVKGITGTINLPTGAATESTLSTLSGKIPSQGQATKSASIPVTLASDQGTVTISPAVACSTTAVTRKAASATDITLASSNANRRRLEVVNASTAILYIKQGGAVSLSGGTESYSFVLNPGDYWEMPQPAYSGDIHGMWSAENGYAMVTETSL